MRSILLTFTELGMLAYWVFASLVALQLISVPPEYMYSDYTNPVIIAWNWSFFPLDALFALTGLIGRFGRFSPAIKERLAVFSYALMFCAGLMAVSFWLIQQQFDLLWWAINLWLMLLSAWALLTRPVMSLA